MFSFQSRWRSWLTERNSSSCHWWCYEVSIQNLWQNGQLILHFHYCTLAKNDCNVKCFRYLQLLDILYHLHLLVLSNISHCLNKRKEFSEAVEIRDCELYPTFIVQGGRGSWSYLPLSPQADLLSQSLGKNDSTSVISLNRLIFISPEVQPDKA